MKPPPKDDLKPVPVELADCSCCFFFANFLKESASGPFDLLARCSTRFRRSFDCFVREDLGELFFWREGVLDRI